MSLLPAALALSVDTPGADWISIGQVERLLQREGYHLIEIEAKDALWEGEATRHGQTWDFTMNPRTGGIVTMERDID